jgi:hypothetical protein
MATMAAAQPKAEVGFIDVYCDSDKLQFFPGGTGEGLSLSRRLDINGVLDLGLGQEEFRGRVSYKGVYIDGTDELRMAPGSLTALCQWGLPESYVAEDVFGSIYDEDTDKWYRPTKQDLALVGTTDEDDDLDVPESNVIMLLYDDENKTRLRGLALCYIDEVKMTLLVLGSIRPTVGIRNRSYAKGGMLLKLVQYLGSTRKYIKLYALETVISLYYKFGWRFVQPSACDPGASERSHYGDAVKTLYKLFKCTNNNPTESKLDSALSPFRGWAKERAQIIRTEGKTGQEATDAARQNGYMMILCKNKNPFNTDTNQTDTNQRSSKKTKLKEGGQKCSPSVCPPPDYEYKKDCTVAAVTVAQKGKRKRGNGGGKRRTKKRALRKKHRGRKTKGKKKKSKKWCKSTKKNNCKKGLWKKKTKLGRASRKWCKSTKKWRKKACKKRR